MKRRVTPLRWCALACSIGLAAGYVWYRGAVRSVPAGDALPRPVVQPVDADPTSDIFLPGSKSAPILTDQAEIDRPKKSRTMLPSSKRAAVLNSLEDLPADEPARQGAGGDMSGLFHLPSGPFRRSSEPPPPPPESEDPK